MLNNLFWIMSKTWAIFFNSLNRNLRLFVGYLLELICTKTNLFGKLKVTDFFESVQVGDYCCD